MTTIDPNVAAGATVGAGRTAAEPRTGSAVGALADWLTTADHKKIGRLHIGVALLVAVAVAVVGALLGLERLDATGSTFDESAVPQLFSLYRVGLTFGVVVPLVLGVCVAVVPLQLGARALAFPRLAMAGFWTWLVGLGLVIGAIAANGGPGGGEAEAVELFLAAHVLVLLGLVATSTSIAASVLTTRAPGMNMRRVPLFSWSALVTALGLILMLPVAAGTLVLLYVDHRYSRLGFGANQGITRWVGFAWSQPQTFLYALPVFGIAAEGLVTGSRRRLRGRGIALTGLGLVGVAAFAGVSQVGAGIRRDALDASFADVLGDAVPYALFNLLPLLGGVVTLAVCVLGLRGGRPRIGAAAVFGVLGAGMVLTGMLGNAVYHLGDARLGGTVFEEGAWIYVCYGTVLGALGGIAHWAPKLWGRAIGDAKALPLAGLGLLATVLASLPYYVAGFAKQPAGATEFDYAGPQDLWNALSLAGHALMALTLVAFAGLAISSLRERSGRPAGHVGDDPWDGQTLEWATSSPAPRDNFAELHVVSSPEPLLDLKPVHDRDATDTQRGAAR